MNLAVFYVDLAYLKSFLFADTGDNNLVVAIVLPIIALVIVLCLLTAEIRYSFYDFSQQINLELLK